MPGAIEFGVTANGTASATARMRLHATGTVAIGDDMRNYTQQSGAHLYIGSNSYGFFNCDSSGSYSSIALSRSGGTHASRSDVANTNILGRYYWAGYSGGTWFGLSELRSVVDGTFTSGQRPPSRMDIYTNLANTAPAVSVTIDSAGAVTMTRSGLVLGSPTGGDKGAGTINVATGIYKKDSDYFKPNYAF